MVEIIATLIIALVVFLLGVGWIKFWELPSDGLSSHKNKEVKNGKTKV